MRSHKLIAAFALALGMAAPAVLVASPATAMATSCFVELHDVDASNVAEQDGRDELRFLVQGNLFPNNGAHNMRSGDDANPSDFGNPTGAINNGVNVAFNLREVTRPALGQGDSLGSAVAEASTCDGLTVGQTHIDTDIISGTDETAYSYTVKLKLTGL
ncbi:hypothetical protein E1295_43575 [Nonomuraea mesophila]|uniref:Allene oxide cyclase barrel-like domain-containing protein n=1 Tax=Nonomuraea mesophila TaxID=2530382 RepID=A0A4R5E7M9_9ACTN|nr:hypothetical protein [Nonomuraea mesophila]TDE26913.1 hypothetical protein E1295_43575 [Nonomuraea mesophila]